MGEARGGEGVVGGTNLILRSGLQAAKKIPRFQNGGLIATIAAAVNGYRDTTINLAVQHRLPAVYGNRIWVDRGGLISYGPDLLAISRLAAGYVDRILKGEKPADLPT